MPPAKRKKSSKAAAKAAGWKPPFPGATPPFKARSAPKKKGGSK